MKLGECAMQQDCARRLADLLNGRHAPTDDELEAGAQLVVTEPDGTEVFRAPLARHHMFDPEDPSVLWLRPVLGGARCPEPDGSYIFNLSLSRRRGLTYSSARIDESGDVVLALHSRQIATIQPAAGIELEELQRWDDFTLNILTAEEETDLDRLDTDSWYGRFG
jgi:hypothetical protein